MITVLAEKPDVAIKIAGTLGGIRIGDLVIPFVKIPAFKKVIFKEMEQGWLETSFKGKECRVTWGVGHLCKLKDPGPWNTPLPIIPEKYEIEPIDAKAKKQLGIIKKLFDASELIINATDFDREGEVIFAYIYQYTKCRVPVKRACYSSMTEEGFLEAFDHLIDGSEMKNTENAGRMRGIADWLVGINLSRRMMLNNPGKDVLSVGRVQTPTLKIVVDRELEIRKFRPEPYWKISAVFETEKGEKYKAEHTKERFLSKEETDLEMEKLSENADSCTVTKIEKKKVTKATPHLYSLATLQMEANAKYGMTLKQTLDTVQSLYTKGLTTYPRTTSQYLTEDMLPTVNRVLKSLEQMPEYKALIEGRKRPSLSRYWFDNSKVESHFAIIPTGQKPGALSAFEKRIFDLIARSVIRMLYGPAQIEETKVETSAGDSVFKSNGSVILDPGWMAVGKPEEDKLLPELSEGQRVKGEFRSEETETKPPKRYTDKSLLSAMITAGKLVDDKELRAILDDPSVNGIGTSATRDAIIEGLIKREYILREQKSFAATGKGIALIDALTVDDVKSPEMTAVWEKRLGNIAKGMESPEVFRKDIEKKVTVWCEELTGAKLKIEEPELYCPKCGKKLKQFKWGFACPDTEACRFTIGVIAGKKLTVAQITELLTKGKTGLIAGFKAKNGKTFKAKLVWNRETQKIDFEFVPFKKKTAGKKTAKTAKKE